jgi:hypothetical protein
MIIDIVLLQKGIKHPFFILSKQQKELFRQAERRAKLA